MSTSSPNTSVLLTVEDKVNTRSQYTAIAPRTGAPQAIAPAPGSRAEGVPLASTSSTGEEDTDEGMKRKRGKDAAEPGSPEWQRMRRDSHKEVERRRREVINTGIDRLAELVPGAEKNKGRIIAQAVEYVHRLRANEEKNIEKWTIEKLLADQAISELTAQVEQLKAENRRLREQVSGGSGGEQGQVSGGNGGEQEAEESGRGAAEDSEMLLDAVAAAAAEAADSLAEQSNAAPARKSKKSKKRSKD
ncbi:basic helix-loop-helix protein [Coemansia erecta]|nr:basic helix-loop-helix protein [Coemansia sp. RSA 2618]KAJ2814414.1 basic helix-loop-helix protein [Coemansia erecta]